MKYKTLTNLKKKKIKSIIGMMNLPRLWLVYFNLFSITSSTS